MLQSSALFTVASLPFCPIISVENVKLFLNEKTTCQFQIKFITKDYLQMYKTVQLNTMAFTI